MKYSEAMKMVNALCAALENCEDDDFVDRVTVAVSCNIPFDEEDIAEQEEAEDRA